MGRAMGGSWICSYTYHAGSHARARFDSRDAATQFAERHARATPEAAAIPLKWRDGDTNDSAALTTRFGVYLVTPAPAEQPVGVMDSTWLHGVLGRVKLEVAKLDCAGESVWERSLDGLELLRTLFTHEIAST
jgi:hypothetical protein